MTDEPKLDVFGGEIAPDAQADTPPADAPTDAPAGDGKKEYQAIPDDHPTIVALKEEIEGVKKEYGGNLSGQRTKIKQLEQTIIDLKKGRQEGTDEDTDLPYPEVKFSKDLTDAEREEMTDTEIKQMDEIAKLQKGQNDAYLREKNRTKDIETQQQVDIQNTVHEHAKKLSTGADGTENVELMNSIIETFNGMKFELEGLSAEDIRGRVELSAKQIDGYTPPKEQPKTPARPAGNGGGTDPYGVDAIVEQAGKGNDGSYSL